MVQFWFSILSNSHVYDACALASIRLNNNELTGTIPVEITGMMQLSKIFLRITCFSQVQIHDSHVEHLFLVPMMVHRGASSWYQSARWYNPSRNRFLAKSSYVFFFYHALWIHRCCLLPYLATNLASRLFVSGELHLYNNLVLEACECTCQSSF